LLLFAILQSNVLKVCGKYFLEI